MSIKVVRMCDMCGCQMNDINDNTDYFEIKTTPYINTLLMKTTVQKSYIRNADKANIFIEPKQFEVCRKCFRKVADCII